MFARWALGDHPNASVLVPPHALLRALREVPDLPDCEDGGLLWLPSSFELLQKDGGIPRVVLRKICPSSKCGHAKVEGFGVNFANSDDSFLLFQNGAHERALSGRRRLPRSTFRPFVISSPRRVFFRGFVSSHSWEDACSGKIVFDLYDCLKTVSEGHAPFVLIGYSTSFFAYS